MSNRKKIPTKIETDLLYKSARRCCICYSLRRDFDQKKGQIAHLDHNPENFNLANLCWLCLEDHDEYDKKTSQSKNLTLEEVKKYRMDLYDTVSNWRETQNIVGNFSYISQIPLLKYFNNTPSVVKTSTKGLNIVDPPAGFRISDKKFQATLTWDIQFKEIMIDRVWNRTLFIRVSMPYGFSIQFEVCANNNLHITNFMNVLNNNLDIWMLLGLPLKKDTRNLIQQPNDFLIIYRTTEGENKIILSTYSVSESLIQFHAIFSDKAIEGFANYLDDVGFTVPFGDI